MKSGQLDTTLIHKHTVNIMAEISSTELLSMVLDSTNIKVYGVLQLGKN